MKSFIGAIFGKERSTTAVLGLLLIGSTAAFAQCLPAAAQDNMWGASEPTEEWGAPAPGGNSAATRTGPRDSAGTARGAKPAGSQFAPAQTVRGPSQRNSSWSEGTLVDTSPYAPVAIPGSSGTDDVSSILLPIPHAGTVLPPPRADVPQPARDAVLPPPLETNSKASLAWRNVAYSLLQQQPGRNLLIRYFKATYSQTMESLKEQGQAEGWNLKGQSIAAGHLLLEVSSQTGNEGAFIFAVGPASDGTTEVRLRIGDSKRAQELANTFLLRAEERAMRKGAPLT